MTINSTCNKFIQLTRLSIPTLLPKYQFYQERSGGSPHLPKDQEARLGFLKKDGDDKGKGSFGKVAAKVIPVEL
jgi:hypothetical protein